MGYIFNICFVCLASSMSKPSPPPPHQTPAASWVSPEVPWRAGESRNIWVIPREKDFQAIQENNTNKLQAKKSRTSKQTKVKASTQIKNQTKKRRNKQLKSQRIGVHPPRAHRLSCTKVDPKIRPKKIREDRYHLSKLPFIYFFGASQGPLKFGFVNFHHFLLWLQWLMFHGQTYQSFIPIGSMYGIFTYMETINLCQM